jgi:hypothetical protein
VPELMQRFNLGRERTYQLLRKSALRYADQVFAEQATAAANDARSANPAAVKSG